MDKRAEIQKYINNFRRHLAPYLKPGIGVISTVYPARQSGAILEFKLGSEHGNDDEFKDVLSSVNDALSQVQQRAFGGNLEGFRFSGTNYVMEDGRIILIKGEDGDEEWNDKAAQRDVSRLLTSGGGGEK